MKQLTSEERINGVAFVACLILLGAASCFGPDRASRACSFSAAAILCIVALLVFHKRNLLLVLGSFALIFQLFGGLYLYQYTCDVEMGIKIAQEQWQNKLAAKRSLIDIKLTPDLTFDQVIFKWGQPDSHAGSGVDYLVYQLNDGNYIWLRFTPDAPARLLGAILHVTSTGERKDLFEKR